VGYVVGLPAAEIVPDGVKVEEKVGKKLTANQQQILELLKSALPLFA